MTRENIVRRIKETIGEGVHASLRKYCDSKESTAAWKAIHDMPDGEWGVVAGVVADFIVDDLISCKALRVGKGRK